MKEVVFELPTTRLFGLEAGAGPTIVCMHGITGNAWVFADVMAALSDQFRVISIDQRGHGRSGRPQGYQADDYAQDAIALARHLQCGPVTLLGHSLGARNAVVAAADCPEAFRAVIAVDFVPFIEASVLDDLAARVSGGGRVFRDPQEIRDYLSNRYPLLPPAAIERRARYGYVEDAGGWRPLADTAAMAATADGLRASFEDHMRRLAVPTLLLRGSVSKLVSPDAWRKALALRPDLEALEIPGSDHYVPEVQAAATAEATRRFLNRLG